MTSPMTMNRGPYRSEAQRWRAVCERDRNADGSFLFAVRSTGIYCRPSCPARRPQQRNVLFYKNAAAAEKAGFRPCKRCRPRNAEDMQHALIEAACRMLDENEVPGLEELARRMGYSPAHFQRLFKTAMGMSPFAYSRARRRQKLAQTLPHSEDVADAVYAAGYGSSSRVYERGRALLGMAPGSFRRGAPGEHIRYTTLRTPLGAMLLGATDAGVCALEFGDSASELLEAFKARFHAARLERSDAALRDWAQRALKLIEGSGQLPLDLRGTAFQLRVWYVLQQIPRGSTLSYAELAKRLGQPKAVRAVASAVANNPVALAVPCHRVIGSDGKLHGYRWGVERKRKLLGREKIS